MPVTAERANATPNGKLTTPTPAAVREEIERALMSAVQFANTTNDLMFVAAYLSRTSGQKSLNDGTAGRALRTARIFPATSGFTD